MLTEHDVVDQSSKWVVFQISDKGYAIPIHLVRSIERPSFITRIPRMPHFVTGVMNLRGTIVPVVDLRVRFQVPVDSSNDSARIIVVHHEESWVGLLVDAANDIVDVDDTSIQHTVDISSSQDYFVKGLIPMGANQPLLILDLERVWKLGEIHE